MTFVITRNDGKVVTYSFDPRHTEDAKKFYRSLVRRGVIASWVMK